MQKIQDNEIYTGELSLVQTQSIYDSSSESSDGDKGPSSGDMRVYSPRNRKYLVLICEASKIKEQLGKCSKRGGPPLTEVYSLRDRDDEMAEGYP